MKGMLGVLVLGLFFSACSGAATQTTSTLVPTAIRTESPSATPTPSVTLAPTETPIPISAICSPLQDHDRIQLGQGLYLTQPLILPQGENKETGHHGVDIAYYRRDGVGEHINGTPIQSVLDSYVAGFGSNPVYGNYVILETPHERLPASVVSVYEMNANESLYLLYAHMQELFSAEIGDSISCGDVVGLVGDSGDPYFVSDPHLHLETRRGPAAVQFGPMSFYNTQATEEEVAEYHFWRVSETFTLLDPLLLLSLEQ